MVKIEKTLIYGKKKKQGPATLLWKASRTFSARENLFPVLHFHGTQLLQPLRMCGVTTRSCFHLYHPHETEWQGLRLNYPWISKAWHSVWYTSGIQWLLNAWPEVQICSQATKSKQKQKGKKESIHLWIIPWIQKVLWIHKYGKRIQFRHNTLEEIPCKEQVSCSYLLASIHTDTCMYPSTYIPIYCLMHSFIYL